MSLKLVCRAKNCVCYVLIIIRIFEFPCSLSVNLLTEFKLYVYAHASVPALQQLFLIVLFFICRFGFGIPRSPCVLDSSWRMSTVRRVPTYQVTTGITNALKCQWIRPAFNFLNLSVVSVVFRENFLRNAPSLLVAFVPKSQS